jgi:hypothetical protein
LLDVDRTLTEWCCWTSTERSLSVVPSVEA